MLPNYSMSSDYAGSPTIFYPRSSPQTFFPAEYTLQSAHSSSWTTVPVASHYISPSIRPKNARKRSREQFDEETPELSSSFSSSPSSSSDFEMDVVVDDSQEPIFGKAAATGMWMDESKSAGAESASEEMLRPSKSVRRGDGSGGSTDAAGNNTNRGSSNGPENSVDKATLMLGIGWRAVGGSSSDSDPDTARAARGWARYVEKHYPSFGGASVEIACRSEGLEAFLVKAESSEAAGWWLFKDDLSEGKLVSHSFEGCVENLRAVPIRFEGQESLFAAKEAAVGDVVMG